MAIETWISLNFARDMHFDCEAISLRRLRVMTLKEAKALLRIIDITITRTKYAEYRVNFKYGHEE